MLPDNFAGALVLSLVNISIVFCVLIFISFVITLTYKIVSGLSKDSKEEEIPPATGGVSVPSDAVPADSLEGPVKAAIMAALAVYLNEPAPSVPIFVRKIRGSGAWASLTGNEISSMGKYWSRR